MKGDIPPGPYQGGVSLAGLASETMAKDMVVLPDHYARFAIEPIHFAGVNKLDMFQFNVLKYLVRHDAKNGIEDIRKAIRYLLMYEQLLLGNPDWWRSYEHWEKPEWVPDHWKAPSGAERP